MDYEKKYKEILEWARKNKARLNGVPIEDVLPELADSEEERALRIIRKRMCYDPVPISDEDRRIVENWLEKQKEPHYTKRNALFDKCVENCDPKTVEEVNKRVDDIMNMPELSAFEQALTNFIGYWEDDEEHWPSKFVKKHGKHILDMAREELQKENPKTADSIPSNCVSDAKCEDRWYKVADFLPDSGRDVLAKDALGNYLLASFDGDQWFVNVYDGEDKPIVYTPAIKEWCDIPSEKQKEQKSAERKTFDEWVEDYWSHNKVNNPHSYNKGDEIQFDHKGFVSFCEAYCYPQNLILHDTFGYEEGRQTGQNEGVKFVLNNPEKYGLQKPAEWSKNDTVFLNEIIDYFENKTVRLQHDIDMYAHWLKSLPERFNLEPKQEWSEEDEEMIGCIIDDIREAKRNSDKEYFKELCDKEIAWLKSLRPDTFQNGNSRPKSPDNWKPSEEMKQNYMRKDALIEWLLKGIEMSEICHSEYGDACAQAYQAVIDKINSL